MREPVPGQPAVVAQPATRSVAPTDRSRAWLQETSHPEDPSLGWTDEDRFGFTPVDAPTGPKLSYQDVRPPSRQVLETIEPYLRTRSATLASFRPGGLELLILTRFGDRRQVHRVRKPLGAREQLTFDERNVARAVFDPTSPDTLLMLGEFGGTEVYTLQQFHMPTRRSRLLSDPEDHVTGFAASTRGGVAYSTFVDSGQGTSIRLWSPERENVKEVLRHPGRWSPRAFSPDGNHLLVSLFEGVDERMLYILDLEQRLIRPLDDPASGSVLTWAQYLDRDTLLVTGLRKGHDFVSLYQLDLRTGRWLELTPGLRWDVEGVTIEPGGRQAAIVINEDGYSALYRVSLPGHRVRRIARTRGVVSGLRFTGKNRLMGAISRSTNSSDVVEFDLRSGAIIDWTRSEMGGLRSDELVDPELVRFPTFDGREIPAFYYRPTGDGPFATLIYAHGGPESQFRPSFKPMLQYYASRGIAIVAPNIRGSKGYGAAYLGLDDQMLRMDAIKDIGAALDWIEARPELAADRVGIAGASYGGFVTLASLVEYPGRLAAGADVVGVADIANFLENTSPYRRDLRRREYGDERDPAMRAFMDRISPVTRAAEIRAPLMVVHGVNDPRVPLQTTEKIVEAVRQTGGEVWYLVAKDEGHNIHSRAARDEIARRMATFFERFLLAPAEMPDRNPEESAGQDLVSESDAESSVATPADSPLPLAAPESAPGESEPPGPNPAGDQGRN